MPLLDLATLLTPGERVEIVAGGAKMGVRTAFVGRGDVSAAGVTEWWARRADGMEEGWTLPTRPMGTGLLTIALAVDGATGWTVGGLRAWDARGRALGVTMRVGPGEVILAVDDAGASYPITVDPVFGTPAVEIDGWWAAAAAGDVNADGYDDMVVSSFAVPPVVVTGSPFGAAGETTIPASTGECTADYEWSYASGVGDVNGDGYDDLVVANMAGGDWCGRAYLGGPAGLTVATRPVITAASDGSGTTIAAVGDMNGDGYADAVLGSRTQAYLYEGSGDGLGSVAVLTLPAGSANAASGGDIDGDGIDDLVYGDGDGTVYIYLGSAGNVSSSPANELTGANAADRFGAASAAGGDIDGDGYDDVVVGAPGSSSGEGRVYTYAGGALGLADAPSDPLSGAPGTHLGEGLGMLGDTDGDGYADVVLESSAATDGSTVTPAVYEGSATGLVSTPSVVFPPESTVRHLSAGVGDLNGDGYADLALCEKPDGTRYDLVAVYAGYVPDPTDADGDGIPADSDCDDVDPDVGAATGGFPDDDADGYAGSTLNVWRCDHMTTSTEADCDDTDASTNPGGVELCDGLDNDCDGSIDEGSVSYVDWDGDGYGAAGTACPVDSTRAPLPGDCDDYNAAINPAAEDVCDNRDNDCDGAVDEGDVSYVDADGDGYGAEGSMHTDCPVGTGYAANPGDCNDTNPAMNPAAIEVCNGLDDDCNGLVDAADPAMTDGITAYVDTDGDGYGSTDTAIVCFVGDGYTTVPGDCDDANASVHPGAHDIPRDGLDANCDGKDGLPKKACGGCATDAPVDGWVGVFAAFGLLRRRRA